MTDVYTGNTFGVCGIKMTDVHVISAIEVVYAALI